MNTQTPKTAKKLVIFGLEDFADIAYEYFTYDSLYEVVAFTVDRQYLDPGKTTKFGLPVVAFEDLEEHFSASDVDIYAAIVYGRLNRIRADVCQRAKAKGYTLASYISSKASVWHNVKFGEHCFVFEDNTIQPFVTVGDNVIFWSGNHIGHHSKIGSDCFFSSHVVVSGWVEIGNNCFLGVNSSIANNTQIGNGCWVNLGTCVAGTIPDHSMVKASVSSVVPLNEEALWRSLARTSSSRVKAA